MRAGIASASREIGELPGGRCAIAAVLASASPSEGAIEKAQWARGCARERWPGPEALVAVFRAKM